LEAHIRKHDLDVALEVDDDMRDMRFEESVETTVYFCCVEVLRAARSQTRLELRSTGGQLGLDVGPLVGMDDVSAIDDRVSALDGSLARIDGGDGSELHIELPLREMEPA
jgi:hypothetical protein